MGRDGICVELLDEVGGENIQDICIRLDKISWSNICVAILRKNNPNSNSSFSSVVWPKLLSREGNDASSYLTFFSQWFSMTIQIFICGYIAAFLQPCHLSIHVEHMFLCITVLMQIESLHTWEKAFYMEGSPCYESVLKQSPHPPTFFLRCCSSVEVCGTYETMHLNWLRVGRVIIGSDERCHCLSGHPIQFSFLVCKFLK